MMEGDGVEADAATADESDTRVSSIKVRKTRRVYLAFGLPQDARECARFRVDQDVSP